MENNGLMSFGYEFVHNEKELNMVEQPHFIVEKLNDGLGFGDGGISAKAVELDAATVKEVDNVIQSPQILVSVDKDDSGEPLADDGCGDGREVGLIFQMHQTFKRSMNRAKIFGGGAVMRAAAHIGLGTAEGKSLEETFTLGRESLKSDGLDYGAHTASQVQDEERNSGCGAIDRAPQILEHAKRFAREIADTIRGLGYADEGLATVLNNFSDYTTSIVGNPYNGRKVMQGIEDDGKVIKQLTGSHKEIRVVLNTVRGYTVNQAIVRQVSGGAAQVFCVDVWRLEDIATKSYKEAAEQHLALLSEVVYTLATAATLTAGDLPIYIIKATA